MKNGDVITLSDFTDFEWDNVIICNPGTSLKDYERFLGNIESKDFDLVKTIIFRKKDEVVKIIKQNYHPEKYPKVEFYISVNSYIILDKEDAVFDVKKINNIELRPVEPTRRNLHIYKTKE